MQAFTHGPSRYRIVRAFGGNPLVRTSDRIEAMVIAVAVTISLAAAPVAGAIGTAVHDARSSVYAEQALTRHTLTASVTGREYSRSLGHRFVATPTIHARWGGVGIERTDTFAWHRSVEVGDQIDIWVDTDGNRVDPPRPPSQAAVDAVGAALKIWLGVVAAAAALVALVRWQLDRIHDAGWEREWSLADNQQSF